MSIRIITDSTVDIPEKYSNGFTVVPMTVSFGDTDYIDGVTLNKQDFYQKLQTSPVLPKTSQATPDAFEKVFRKLRDQGDEGIVITVSSRLSGTYQSACIAAADYPNVRIVDSLNVSIASGILAMYALQCVREGRIPESTPGSREGRIPEEAHEDSDGRIPEAGFDTAANDTANDTGALSLDALADHLIRKRDEVSLVAMLDTLEYLKKGGRISGVAAFAGGVLNIKPVVTARDGELAILGKARGSKKANNLLVEQINKDGVDFTLPLFLGYTGTSDDMLQQYIRDSQSLWKGHVTALDCVQLCSVIGTHAGPGAVAVAYFKSR